MSAFQNPQLFPFQPASAFNHKVIHVFANILRNNFREEFSAIKEIHLKTGIDPRSIENWYQARNAPSSMHLIMLAHHIPDVVEAFLTLAGREEVWIDYLAQTRCSDYCKNSFLNVTKKDLYLDRNVTVNGTVNSLNRYQLNDRQKWFLEKINHQYVIKASDVMNQWGVAARTARRDIAGLVSLKLIYFDGADKNGKYKSYL